MLLGPQQASGGTTARVEEESFVRGSGVRRGSLGASQAPPGPAHTVPRRAFLHRVGLGEAAEMRPEALRCLFFLVLMTLFLNADQNLINPNIDLIEKDLGINDYQLGAVASAFTLLGALVTLFWGYLTDFASRKKLLFWTVLLGEIPCFMTAFSRSYGELYFWRVLTGLGVGGAVPLNFSLVADYFSAKDRAAANAWIGTITGLGLVFGMLMAGFVGPAYGWRLPFILASVPNFVLVPLFYLLTQEPKRGEGEPELKTLLRRGAVYRAERPADYRALLRVPTNILSFIQGIPGTVPWGIMPFFIVTFYSRDKGFSIQAATLITMVFGAGCIVGGFVGGIIGNRLYNIRRAYLPAFNGIAILGGMIPAYVVMNWPVTRETSFAAILLPGAVAFITGVVATMPGPNVTTVLMNVNLPENRGAISSVFNLTDSVGKGFGPLIGGFLSVRYGLGWTMNFAITFWLLCGVWWFWVARTAPRDEDRLRQVLRARAEEMSRERG